MGNKNTEYRLIVNLKKKIQINLTQTAISKRNCFYVLGFKFFQQKKTVFEKKICCPFSSFSSNLKSTKNFFVFLTHIDLFQEKNYYLNF